MANTAILNRMMRKPEIYWRNRGHMDGFEGRKSLVETRQFPGQKWYEVGFKEGERARKNLEQDAANGEFK